MMRQRGLSRVNFIGMSLILLGLLGLSVPSAFAKKIKIEWEAIEDAIKYEIEIQPAPTTPVAPTGKASNKISKITEDPVWKGNLPEGIYTYKIRAIDRFKRAGQWSTPLPLVALPRSPSPTSPKDGDRFVYYSDKKETVLKWDSPQEVKKYDLELNRDKKPVLRKTLTQSEMKFQALPEGKYTWRVRGILEEGKKTWKTEPSDEQSFRLEYQKLEAPKLTFPTGVQPPPEDHKVEFRWKEVEGAEAYELSLSSSQQKIMTFKNSHTLSILKEGKYQWQVRALTHLDEHKVPLAIGPEGKAEFSLDRIAFYKNDFGYVAFSWMLAPYTYRVVSPTNSVEGNASSTSMVYRFSGERWLGARWGVSAAVEYASFQLSSQGFGRKGVELQGKFRWSLSSSQFGWTLLPKMGFEMRDYNQVIPTSSATGGSGVLVHDIYVLGLTPGFDLRKQFSSQFSLGMKFGYFYPLKLLSGAPDGSVLGGGATSRNLSVGLQGVLWLNSNWAIGAGGYYDQRSIGYSTTSSASQEEVYMDAVYFYASVIYRLWH